MIKPRYIKSLTFLLLCDMALWDRKQLLGGPSGSLSASSCWFVFGPL